MFLYINEAIAPAEQYDPVINAKIPCVIPWWNYKWRGKEGGELY